MDYIDNFLPTFEHLGHFSYWLILLIAFLESIAFIGLAIPGTILLIFFGFFAYIGFFSFVDLVWFSVVGAILGDGFSFYLGKNGKKLFSAKNRIFKSEYLQKGENFFKRFGNKSVFIGRFIGPLRPIIPFVAGLFKMRNKNFFFWNILSAFVWACLCLSLGYFFGHAWEAVAVWSTRAGIFVLGLAVFLAIILLFKWLVLKHGKPVLNITKSFLVSLKKAFLENEYIEKFIKNNPKLIFFLNRRISWDNFWGMPLTLLGLAFIYILFVFLGVLDSVLTYGPIVETDLRVANLLFLFRTAVLIKVFLWITVLCRWEIIVSFSVILSLIFLIWKKKLYIFILGLTLGGTALFTYLGKIFIHRPRPDLSFYVEKSFSFPSGHASFSIAFYGLLVYFLLKNIETWKNKINLIFGGVILILLIGFSRLYLGVHYLSDVFGGYLLGLLWLIIGIFFMEWLIFKGYVKDEKNILTKKVKIGICLLLLLELFFYIDFAYTYRPKLKILEKEEIQTIVISNLQSIFTDYNISKYSEMLDGTTQEPMSFIIAAKDDIALIGAFEKSGWYLADKTNSASLLKIIKAVVLNANYPSAPMSPSFWNNNIHDLGFEKPTESKTVRERHHARFWKINFQTADGKKIYIGTASFDEGVKWGITHKIKPDIDTEREYIFNDLLNSINKETAEKFQLVAPVLGKNFSGDQFFTDGRAYLIYLTN